MTKWLRLGLLFLLLLMALILMAGCSDSDKDNDSDTNDSKGENSTDWTPVMQEFNGVTMVQVPAGCFMMGSTEEQIDAALQQCNQETDDCERSWFENEAPAHRVCFEEPFWIDRTEVTRAMYAECVNAGGCSRTPDSDYSTEDNQPIDYVTWYQAEDYCIWRDARLPTEAQWEYAARGPDALKYPWGNKFVANNVVYYGNSDAVSTPVGSKPGGVSWVGALDMSGNMAEWIADWYDRGYYISLSDGTVDPQGPDSGTTRVLRGGSFYSYSSLLRAADRVGLDTVDNLSWVSFRCARDF